MPDLDNDKTDVAEDLLATADSTGMTIERAEKVIADPEAPEDLKSLADEVLAEAETYALTEESAQEILAQENSK